MRTLSKTKLLAYRQCSKRLWLEIHRPQLREDSAASEASFAVGHQVGEIARRLYDPAGKGTLIEVQPGDYDAAFSRTQAQMSAPQTARPIFEAGFRIDGALAFADVLLPLKRGGKRGWRMVEVKSSTEVKDYHRDDAAIQSFVARSSGIPLHAISLAHIDKTWTYPGNGDYAGLLLEQDVTVEAFARSDEVRGWIADAQRIAAKRKEPTAAMGRHCTQPYACGFSAHCQSQQPQAQYPLEWLPNRQGKALLQHIESGGITQMGDVPDALLNPEQLRVKQATLSGKTFFDRAGAAQALATHKLPAYFVDFESVMFAVPIWKGTRPYQNIPFQFSVHRLSRTGKLHQQAFLDLKGSDPSKAFAEALIGACGNRGAIFVYNASFEKARIKELAQRFPRLATALLALNERVVDLLTIARQHYYHPDQRGSWSLKAVLPTLGRKTGYDALDGVKNGGMAMRAYAEAIAPQTSAARKAVIEQELLDYCALDTLAMVRMWSVFTGTALAV